MRLPCPVPAITFYFHNLKVVSRELHGIRLLLGTELNILDSDGQVDLGGKRTQKYGRGDRQPSSSLHETGFTR